jgi:histone H3/H4
MLKRIRELQRQEGIVMPKAPFSRVVRELAGQVADEKYRWEAAAIDALQLAAEDYMTVLF